MIHRPESILWLIFKKLRDDTLISTRFQGVNTCLTKSENGTDE